MHLPVRRLAAPLPILAVALGLGALPPLLDAHAGAAMAQHQDGGGGTEGTHEDGTHDDGSHEDGDQGQGGPGYRGGAGDDPFTLFDQTGDHHEDGGAGRKGDGQGRRGEGGAGGTRPPWAQEGLPEIELGRLNVVRAPENVLDRAYDEALAGFTAEMAPFYNLPLDQMLTRLETSDATVAILDSPLQNLALLRDALDGTSVLNTLPQVENDVRVLQALFLGVASDKSIPVTAETAWAVARLLGYDLTQEEAARLAADAELVRQAVLAGHG